MVARNRGSRSLGRIISRFAPVFGVLALAVALRTEPSAAQVRQVQDTTLGDTILVDKRLIGTADSFRIHLVSGGQYRVALWPGTAQLETTSDDHRARTFAPRVREGVGPAPTVIELYPSRSADYLLIVTTPGGTESGRVQLWADRQLARELQAERDRAWGIGVSVMGDLHSGYLIGPLDPNPAGGSSGLEGCLVVGSSGPLSGCLGINYQGRGNGADAVTWYFIEPRALVVSVRALDRPLDFLLSVRVAQGHLSQVSVDPSLIAPGFLIAYHLDDRPGVRGWRLLGQFYYAWVGNTAIRPKETFTRVALGLSWAP